MSRRVNLPKAAVAKQVWQSMANPSTRRVATKLRQAGASISHATVARWRTEAFDTTYKRTDPTLSGVGAHPRTIILPPGFRESSTSCRDV